jgi:uncharacterized protein YutE (UPF0331/DUF86 family)
MYDIVLRKKASIERCIEQIHHYYHLETGNLFLEDYLKQDGIALNLQRLCDLSIDLANMTIKFRKLGLPSASRESFLLLETAKIIDRDLCKALMALVGYRNKLVHDYQKIKPEDLELFVTDDSLSQIVKFTNVIVKVFSPPNHHPHENQDQMDSGFRRNDSK